MRRILICTIASAAVVAIAPTSALAQHHRGRHHHHHHQARVHHRKFGSLSQAPGSSSGGPSNPTPTNDTAGKVASFDSTTMVLIITLNDGSTVSGKVTPDTEIECQGTQGDMSQSFSGDDDGPGGGDNSGGQGGDDQGEDNQGGDDQGEDDQGEDNQQCSTADLTQGAVVIGAELRISSAGASWDKVELQ
jgi:hypothetical protein